MRQERATNNVLAGFAEDLDAAQMMLDGRLEGCAKDHAEASVERLKADLPSVEAKLSCELGKIACEVNLAGETYFIKSRR